MREILFKAKAENIDGTFDWIEGYLSKCEGKWTICDDEGVGCFVEEETICQYTGLTDKNGNKIWENDVCYYDDMDVCVVRFGEYDNNTGHKHVGFYTAWRKYKYMFRSDIGFWVKERELEVIGNIFDNPELLEGR